MLARLGLEHAGDDLRARDPARLAAEARLLGGAAAPAARRVSRRADQRRRSDHAPAVLGADLRGAAAGTTVLVTTHYMDEAEYCDRISIMVAGRIAAMGTPAELKQAVGAESIDEVFVRLARPAQARRRVRAFLGLRAEGDAAHPARPPDAGDPDPDAGGAGRDLRLRDPHRRARHRLAIVDPDAGRRDTWRCASGSPPSDRLPRRRGCCRARHALEPLFRRGHASGRRSCCRDEVGDGSGGATRRRC